MPEMNLYSLRVLIRKLEILALTSLLLFSIACSSEESQNINGDRQAIMLAQVMIENLGGKERWESLSSLHIKAVHHEKRLDKPYQSEIWRNLNPLHVKIHQRSDEFSIKRIFNSEGGWVIREGKVDTLRESSFEFLKNWDQHLFYRTLHDIAAGHKMTIQESGEKSFTILKNDTFRARITLNENGYPFKYETLNLQRDTLITLYPEWDETDGYKHPIVAMAPDSSFVFETIVWEPFTTNYPDSIFNVSMIK